MKSKLFRLAPMALFLAALSLPFAGPALASGGPGGGISGGGGGGGGGGGVGGGCDLTPTLPTTPPAPDIFMRESFGQGPQQACPMIKSTPSTTDPNITATYEFRLNGTTGPLLATGGFLGQPFNEMTIRYDPSTGLAGASLNGTELGSFPAGLATTPKFVGFEGVGIVNNFVVRNVQ